MPLPCWRFRRLVVLASALAFVFICAVQWSHAEALNALSAERGSPLLSKYLQTQSGKGGGECGRTIAIPAVSQS